MAWVALVAATAGEMPPHRIESAAQMPFVYAMSRTAAALAPKVSPIILA